MSQEKRLELIKTQVESLILQYEDQKKRNQALEKELGGYQQKFQELKEELVKLQKENTLLSEQVAEASTFRSSGFLDREKERYLDYINKDIDWLVNL